MKVFVFDERNAQGANTYVAYICGIARGVSVIRDQAIAVILERAVLGNSRIFGIPRETAETMKTAKVPFDMLAPLIWNPTRQLPLLSWHFFILPLQAKVQSTLQSQ
ncbi:hypothetical protein HML84_05640 [Alcanivorax sp. IO_7]|nr:hypothetical protein HML84_05640 [Alcanivorax sp. IO_7]